VLKGRLEILLKVIVVDNNEEMSAKAAEYVKNIIVGNPTAAMVLAMGNTPMGMYARITEMRTNGLIDTSQLRVFQLDGYLGLNPDDPRSLEGWLRRSVIEPWGIPEQHVVLLPENGEDTDQVCRIYKENVKQAGGFELAILGLGPNGHLGFNEPPSFADSATRVVALTEESIQSNTVYWGSRDQVPRMSITAGMDILLGAKQILLLVSGSHKQDILRQTLEAPLSENLPSSFLRSCENVTIIADKAAWPEGLTMTD
jgi:glucosamine-6-phosphate deaminase